MYSRLILLLLPILGIVYVHAKTGEEIADALYQHPNECKDPKDGGIWAPLQGENPPCGAQPCNYPQEWCSATSDPNAANDKPKLNCVPLPPDCQKALEGGSTTAGGAETTTSAAAETTTTQATTTSPTTQQTTTKATTKATTAGAGATTAAPGGTTPAGGCKDANDLCCFWAAKQQCDMNPGWMRTNCQSSCGTCGCQASSFQTCKVTVNTTGCKYLPGGGGAGNKVRIQLGGGPGIAAMFGQPPGFQGSQGGNGSMVTIPLGGGMPMGGMPGFGVGGAGSMVGMPSPQGGFGGAGSMVGQPGSGTPGTGGSNKVTIPVGGGFGGGGFGGGGCQSGCRGRKRRHFMPRWFNNA